MTGTQGRGRSDPDEIALRPRVWGCGRPPFALVPSRVEIPSPDSQLSPLSLMVTLRNFTKSLGNFILTVTLCVMGGGVVSDAEGLGLIWEMNEPWPSSTKLLAFSKKPNKALGGGKAFSWGPSPGCHPIGLLCVSQTPVKLTMGTACREGKGSCPLALQMETTG